MKSIQYILWFFVVLFSSCQKNLLETIPNDRISSEVFWKTKDDVIYAANAVYTSLEGIDIVKYDALTDILVTNRGFDDNLTIQRGYGTSSSSLFYDDWSDLYRGVQLANDFLKNVYTVPIEDNFDQYIAEVKVIRAYHYIRLVALYGDVPLVTVPLTVEEGRSIARTEADQVWDFVIEELNTAANLLEWKNESRINKGTAYALLARAALYAGRYEEAYTAAKNVIDSRQFSLHNSYFDLFQYEGEGNSEILLQREYAASINAHNIYTLIAPWSQIAGSNGSVYVPTAKIVDLYETSSGKDIRDADSGFDPKDPYKNRDPRLEASVFLNGVTPLPAGGTYGTTPNTNGSDAVQTTVYSTATGYNIRKYVAAADYNNPANSGLNIILLRYAEVLLTYAEARIENNEIDASVYEAINAVRGRTSVNLPPIVSDQSRIQLRELVRRERTIELAFEGHRLFDLRRWKTAEAEIPGGSEGITYVENNVVKQVVLDGYDRIFDVTRDYLWPIPHRERELNSNLTQNNNW